LNAQRITPQPGFVWAAQLAGTVAIAIAIYLFLGRSAPSGGTPDPMWARYGLMGILAAAAPALWFLRAFRRSLNADVAACNRNRGAADAEARRVLLRNLSIGGALCELPLALGVLYLLMGSEARLFVGAACVSVALRLSYRPFTASRP